MHTPQRGEKRELVEHARVNAQEALARRLAEHPPSARSMPGSPKLLDLDEPPERIEVYDNSHISGTNPVGAMIVAGPEGFIKAQYRKFNMKVDDLTPGDDYAMMRQMLTRRFSRLLKERESDEGEGWAAPDLVLIDGGPGPALRGPRGPGRAGPDGHQSRRRGQRPRPERRPRAHLSSRARNRCCWNHATPCSIASRRLRDEAHRFAIGAHRTRRKKGFTASPLDEVPGIGPTRKRALLQHFGSAKAVSRAGIADLESCWRDQRADGKDHL